MLNEQQLFWKEEFSEQYVETNSGYDFDLELKGWQSMLAKASGISNVLECGSSVGRNIRVLNQLLPDAKKSIIELNDSSYKVVSTSYDIDKSFNGAITDADFPENQFDLVYSQGVLIMIHPNDLLQNMQKMYTLSSKYILIGEYFSKAPVMIPYHGRENLLFKCDFGRMFLENFDVSLVDYGFLWSLPYKNAFDDITWWLFEKK